MLVVSSMILYVVGMLACVLACWHVVLHCLKSLWPQSLLYLYYDTYLSTSWSNRGDQAVVAGIFPAHFQFCEFRTENSHVGRTDHDLRRSSRDTNKPAVVRCCAGSVCSTDPTQ